MAKDFTLIFQLYAKDQAAATKVASEIDKIIKASPGCTVKSVQVKPALSASQLRKAITMGGPGRCPIIKKPLKW